MAFCENCGAQIGDNEQFCPNCGTAVGKAPAQPKAAPAGDDVQDNKGISVLSYLGPLVFIPLFARKNSPYAQFHARQGFTLFAIEVASWVLEIILSIIFRRVPIVHNLINWLLNVGICVLAVIGIINAAKGNKKELPLIGKLDVFGWFKKS